MTKIELEKSNELARIAFLFVVFIVSIMFIRNLSVDLLLISMYQSLNFKSWSRIFPYQSFLWTQHWYNIVHMIIDFSWLRKHKFCLWELSVCGWKSFDQRMLLRRARFSWYLFWLWLACKSFMTWSSSSILVDWLTDQIRLLNFCIDANSIHKLWQFSCWLYVCVSLMMQYFPTSSCFKFLVYVDLNFGFWLL